MIGTPPALVILAAGASRRMGECKALKLYDGQSALEHLLGSGHAPEGPPALVISGPTHAHIQAHLGSAAEVVFNSDWSSGRLSSLLHALRARPGRDLILAPVDHPWVPLTVFVELRRAWADAGAPPMGWLAPRVERPGQATAYGHPVLVGRSLMARIADFSGDTGLRELRGLATPLLSVAAGVEVLANLDAPGDIERAQFPETFST